jgi:hypothetical protein
MTAEIIRFSRYRCACQYCRAVALAWAGPGGPARFTLAEFLDDNARLLQHAPLAAGGAGCQFIALDAISEHGSPMSRRLARAILCRAVLEHRRAVLEHRHCPGDRDPPDAA